MKLCKFYRRLWLLFPEPQSRWSQPMLRHADHCPDCSRSLERERAFIAELRRTAPSSPPELPPFLKHRILANLPERSAVRLASAKPVWRWLQQGVLAGIAFAVLVSFWPKERSEPTESHASRLPSTTEVQNATEPGAPWFADSARILQWTELGGQPLQGEFEKAVEDGRRFLTAAVQSAVPDPAAAVILAQADHWMGAVKENR